MTKKMRVHELAKELGKSSREIVSMLHELGVPVSSAANTLDDEAILKIREKVQAAKKPAAKLIKKPKEEPEELPVIMIKTEATEVSSEAAQKEEIKEPQEIEAVEIPREPQMEIDTKIYIDDTSYDYSAAILDAFQAGVPAKEAKEEVPIKEQELAQPEVVEEKVEEKSGEVLVEEEKPKKKKKGKKKEEEEYIEEEIISPPVVSEITIPEGITLRDLAQRLGVKSKHILKRLLEKGYLININQSLSGDLAQEIARDFGCKATIISYEEEVLKMQELQQSEENLQPRPPIVTFMGHVDHGKTTLLDYIRKAKVADKEVGGITQKIGAYKVFVKDKAIVFLDTPGHEAFTKIRARGAKVTDIVVLVVAADDGVMPQTIEAINHARSANATIMVAINKIDKPNANVEKVKRQLSEAGILVEDWGGKIVAVPISAKTGQNVDVLLEMILLQAELLELKADPTVPAQGVVLESKLDPRRGPIATVLVQNGTLKLGDVFIAGCCMGKVRAMFDDQGKGVTSAPPSYPVEVLGFDSRPEAGDVFQVVLDESKARDIVLYRQNLRKAKMQAKSAEQLSLEHLYSKIKEGLIKEFPLIIKADAQGSIEALLHELSKIESSEIQIRIIHSGVGAINYSDVLLADASKAIIIGFNVRAEAKARELAEREKVEIRYYNIIYTFIDEIKKAMIGMLEPEYKETIIGTAEVRKVYHISKVGTVAGCFVTSGKVVRNYQARLVRDNIIIYDGKINTLKRHKDDVAEVNSGYECGITLLNFNDIKEEDVIEVYTVEKIKHKTLI